jgi:HTH-type transcriptional regulator/antitoxin MqsA
MSYDYKDNQTVIPAVTGDYCPACEEVVIDKDDAQRVSEAMLAFNRQINARLADPTFIRRVRVKLDLDQRQAAALFGGGHNAFSRYETGVTAPPVAVVKLLTLLDRHPELLAEIR